MRREAVRAERGALGPLKEEELVGLVEESLETLGEDPEAREILVTDSPRSADFEPGALLLYPDTASPTDREAVETLGGTLWDEADVVREVGKSALAMLGAGYSLSLDEAERKEVEASPVRTGKEEAREKAGKYVNSPGEPVLEMVPYRTYRYRLDSTVSGEGYEREFQGRGRVALDLVEGEVEELDFRETERRSDPPGMVLDPEYGPAEADELVRELLSDEMEEDLKLEKQEGETLIEEKRSVRPELDDFEISGGELVHRGFWRVPGQGDEAVIDSYTGEVLSPEMGGAEMV